MSSTQEEHGKDHEALVRLLVEGELEGHRKQAAEKYLLSCLDCLKEYNSYRRFLKTVTSNDYRRAREEYLKQTNVELYRQYTGLMERFATASSRPVSPFAKFKQIFSPEMVYQPALGAALMVLLVLTLPYFAYKYIRLERERTSLLEANRDYQRRIERQSSYEKIQEEARTRYEKQIAALSEKIAGLSKPEMATSYSIVPRSYQRGRVEEYAPVKLAKEAKFLILTVRLKSNYATYFIEIFDATREGLWQKSGVKMEDESISLVIPREFFKKDRYSVTIHGVTSRGERKLVSEFPLRITGQ